MSTFDPMELDIKYKRLRTLSFQFYLDEDDFLDVVGAYDQLRSNFDVTSFSILIDVGISALEGYLAND